MAEFVFGVKTEAERLREIGIDPGNPYRDEYWFTHDLAVQATTTGQFWIHKIGENFFVQFFPKAVCSR